MGKYFKNVIMPKEMDDTSLQKIARGVAKAIKERVICATYYWRIGCDIKNGWYITAGWVDGFDADHDGNKNRLCMKVAYIPENSYMMDYDYDFMMPVDEATGEVWDTEVSTSAGDTEQSLMTDIKWLMKEFNEMVTQSRELMERIAA